MLHQVVEIHEENRYLSLYRGFLKIKTRDENIGAVPLDDIAVLLVSSQGLSLTKNIIVELAERGAISVFCGKNYSPQAIVYPVTGNYHQAGVLKSQILASVPFQKNIWKRIIEIKLENQSKALSLCGKEKGAKILEKISAMVKSGDPDNKEARGARIYWTSLFGKDFIRDKDEEGINSLLNYGYAIMRSSMARALCAAGLNPSLGVHHCNVLNNFCLADDLFEIYRPIVDYIVYKIVKEMEVEISPKIKQILIKALWVKMKTTEGTSPAFQSMHYMASSFVKSLKSKASFFEIPVWEGKDEEFSCVEQV